MTHFSVLVTGRDLVGAMEPFHDYIDPERAFERECLCRRWPASADGVEWTNPPDPTCESCGGSGIELWESNPIGRWDSWTVTNGRFLYRAGARSAAPDNAYVGLCHAPAWIGDGPGRFPALLTELDGSWDHAVLSDLDIDAITQLRGVPWTYAVLNDGRWSQLHDGAGWFPSIEKWSDRIEFVDEASWPERWQQLFRSITDDEIISLIDCHT